MTQLTDGYFDVPAGKIAAVVTSLEMTERPPHRPDPPAVPWRLVRIGEPQPAAYRRLFRNIGSRWLWFSRLKLTDAALQAIIGADGVEIHHLIAGTEASGLLELDFRESGTCELSYFGVVPGLIGTGAGRWLMNRALEIVWSRDISRFWVHSCTLDHPAALEFYRRSGFRPFRRQIEIADDPRLSGLIAPEEAAHLPVI
jgi:GNAT superfamily N-acetyltransferase